MRYLFGLLCVCSLGVLPILGCSETTGDGGAGGDAGTGGSAGTGGTGGMPEVRTYLFSIDELNPDGTTPPLEGVQVCEADADPENCVMSNAFGIVTLFLPADQEVTITMDKEGYGRWVTGDVSDETFDPTVTGRRMYTDAQLAAIAGQLQTPYPWQGGIVGLVTFPSLPAGGATFAPVGSTVDAVGDSFYYDSATEEYSLDLDATTAVGESWLLPLAEGGFTEITPGEQQFEYGGTAGDCEASWAWPGDTANTIRVPVREGYRTYGSMICTGQ